MKINPISNQNLLQSYRAGKAAIPEKTRKKGTQDEVSISSEALSFSKTLSEIKDKMEVRSTQERAHIDEIKEKIRNGEYHVDSALVAEKILSSIIPE